MVLPSRSGCMNPPAAQRGPMAEEPLSEIVKRDSTVIAWEAMRVAVQLQERSHDALLRAQAELRLVRIQPTRSSCLEGLLL